MHFIDVGFKQSGYNENEVYSSETILYGVTELGEEVDLYKIVEKEQELNKEKRKVQLIELDKDSLGEIKNLLMKKIENNEIKDDFSVLFDNNEGIDVQNYSYLIATKLDFEEKIKLLNTINETIIDTQSFPSIEELIKYDKEFSNFDSTGEYAIYMLWVIERHLINDKNIEAIKKTNKDLIKVIAYLASKLNNNETVDYDEGEKLKYLRPGIQ